MADVLATGVDYTPTNVMSYQEYNDSVQPGRNLYGAPDMDVLANDLRHKYRDEYNAYLTNVANENEYKATQSARAWEEYMQGSQYQRAVKDLEKAGLNPWLAIQNGGVSGAGTSSSAKGDYKKGDSNTRTEGGLKGRDIALMLLATAKVVAAVA